MFDDHAPHGPALEATADAWIVPEPLDLTFEGFAPEAFALLERLRQAPHIAQYREEKAGIKRYITDPFKRFRDDLVINGVLPNRLDFETEKNVFSRLLKNDFGAGGCHHHLWMAFYRPGLRRLTDVQLAPCITPDGFTMGLFVGASMKTLLQQAKRIIAERPAGFVAAMNPLLQDKNWTFAYYYGAGKRKKQSVWTQPLDTIPDDLSRADGLWLRRAVGREEGIAMQGALVGWTLATWRDLWPFYQAIIASR